jgi:dephospho-CoA kinase
VVHDLYEDPEVRAAVVARFGDEVAPAGAVDRRALAAHAFGDAGERAWLEGLLWPRVGRELAQWRAGLERRVPPPRAAVVEVPLLFEAEMEGAFDATVAVVAPEALRAARAAGRGHAALDERAARHLPQAEKARRASFVVDNAGDEGELERKLSAILDKL